MAQYAWYNPQAAISGVAPVMGYFDIAANPAASLPEIGPASALYEMTEAENTERFAGLWAVNVANPALMPYTPPVVPPTLQQQATAALAGTVTVTSTSQGSTLNGTYPVNAQTQFLIISELQSITTNNTFADGTTTLEWMDAAGVQHAFSISEFKSFATQVGAYCSTLYRIAAGTTGLSLPSPNITVA